MKPCFLVFLAQVGCFAAPQEAHECWKGMSKQCEAEWIIWGEQLGVSWHSPPNVVWVKGTTCPYNTEWNNVIVRDGECLDGYFYSSTWYIASIWTGRFSTTAMAHEFYHAYLHLKHGDSDSDHADIGWNTTVPNIDIILASKGL